MNNPTYKLTFLPIFEKDLIEYTIHRHIKIGILLYEYPQSLLLLISGIKKSSPKVRLLVAAHGFEPRTHRV